MEKPGEESGFNKYEFFRDQTLSQIEEHLQEMALNFEAIRERYSEEVRMIGEEDHRRLWDYIGDLLAMAHNQAVKEEELSMLSSGSAPYNSKSHKIQKLLMEISRFLSRFSNTGVTIYDVPGGIDSFP